MSYGAAIEEGSAGSLMVVERTLIVQLNPALTDSAVRRLRDVVGSTLEAQQLRALVINMASVDMMDSYLTRCIRDLAVSARLMGVPTIVCGVQPAVADTLVEMGMDLGDVRTTLNLDSALRLVKQSRRARS
ncbi:MAG: STAS domain-containing protein [Polyangiaceae bacterium]|nr:STAS domain-containing protein [Polyangiaceae bacterium]